MIYLGVFLLFVFAISCLVFVFSVKDDTKSGSFLIGFISLFVGLILTIFSTIHTVSAGNVGVVTTFGNVSSDTLSSGVNFVNPFCEVSEMSVRTENYVMSATHDEGTKKGDDSVVALSSNGLRMPMDISIPYRLVENQSAWVFKNFGPNYVEKIIRPAARTAVRRATSKFTDQECYSTKRDELALKMKSYLEEEIGLLLKNYDKPPEQVVLISQVMIGNVDLPETVKNAIERKLKADQESQEMEFKITKEKREAERKEIEAHGIQKFQEIVSKGIDERLLRWKGIDATLHLAESPNAKVIVIGSGKDGLPIILGGLSEKK